MVSIDDSQIGFVPGRGTSCNLCGPTAAEVQVEPDQLEVIAYPSATWHVTTLPEVVLMVKKCSENDQ